MLAYCLVLFLLLPVGVAMIFLFFSNSLLRRAAVFFMAAVLAGGMVFLALSGGGSVRPSASLMHGLMFVFSAGSFVLLAITAWLGWRWQNFLLIGLVAAQSALLAWVCFVAGPDVLAPGEFILDHLSMAMLFLFNCVGPLALLAVVRQGSEGCWPYRCLAAATALISAMNGLVLAGNLLGMFFFWQLAMLLSAFTAIHGRIGAAGRFMGYTVVVHALGGGAFLGGTVLCLAAAGTLQVKALLMVGDALPLMLPLTFFIVAGIVGSAQFPFQGSLLRSGSLAGADGCALLQGATVLNAGIYLILRLSPLFMNTWLAKMAIVLGAFSFAAGALLALLQHEVKRGLTYSTVSILGLGMALACMADLQAIYAAVWVVVFHSMGKTSLFLCAGSRSVHPVSGYWLIAAAVSMIMPPFGVPMGLWTAVEGTMRQPVALFCLIIGSLFYLLFWAQFIGARLPGVFANGGGWRDAFLSCRTNWILGLAVLIFGLFQIPLTHRFLAPILKENFGRFDDIAQADAQGFLIATFSGVNPALLLLVIAAGGLVAWTLLGRSVGVAKEQEKQEEQEESLLQAAPIDLRSAVFPWLPVRRRLELYCSLMAVALIVVMFEVIAR